MCLVGFGGHLGAVERILLITPLTPPCHLVSMLQQRLYTMLMKKSTGIVFKAYVAQTKSKFDKSNNLSKVKQYQKVTE